MALRSILSRTATISSAQLNQIVLRIQLNKCTLYRREYPALSASASALSLCLSSTYQHNFVDHDRRMHSAINHRDIRYYSKNINDKIKIPLAKNQKLIAEKFEKKRAQFKERKEVLIQELRDKKTKVKEKMEEIVERENIMTIPNLLSVGRIILAPYVAYVIVQENYQFAIALLAVAGITDLLDGFIARTWSSQASKLGSFLDPMADKLLVGALVISLSWCSLFPIWLSAMVILRDIFLIIAGFIIRFISLPPPRTLSRYFDATHVTAKLEPTLTSKVNTAVQLITIGASLGAPIYGYIDHTLLQTSWYFTGLTTVIAALSYVLTRNTYQIIRKHNASKRD